MVPLPVPAHDHVQGPEPDTAEAVPALHNDVGAVGPEVP